MNLKPNFTSLDFKYTLFKFPAGELQVTLLAPLGGRVRSTNPDFVIKGSILSSDNIIELLQLVEALRFHNPELPIHLVMPYCAYSRQDRRCNTGEAFSLKVFAQLINSCNFVSVTTYDNHSDVATALIDNCENIHVTQIFDYSSYKDNMILDTEQYDYLISPDAGANKKVFQLAKALEIPFIRADKTRDIKTGAIISTQVYLTEDQLKHKTVLIVDDICQGGRTFEELAKAMREIEPSVIIHLYTTHGFFSHSEGLKKMLEAGISKFITTSSTTTHPDSEYLTVLDIL